MYFIVIISFINQIIATMKSIRVFLLIAVIAIGSAFTFHYYQNFNNLIKKNQVTSSLSIQKEDQLSLSTLPYNITESKEFLILGLASYCNQKCLSNWTCQITKNFLNDTVTDVTYIMGTITRAQGYVAYDKSKNMIVTGWRGSANIQNWIEDFQFDFVDYSKCKNCKVHIGFMDDYLSIQKKMTAAMLPLLQKYPTASILSTGWSLGGALSIIVGIQLKLKYNREVIIHNNGCPRVGNSEFAQFVSIKIPRIYRLVHDKDLVPHLPPQFFGFHHTSYQIFFDKYMKSYTICNQNGQDSKCSNQFFPQFNPNDHMFYFWDLNSIIKC